MPLVNIGGNTKKMDADLKAPVIIVLGKVEAGKTKLLEKIMHQRPAMWSSWHHSTNRGYKSVQESHTRTV